MWTVISGIFGGVFRLLPELFKYLDKKSERKHELDMQDKAIEFQKLKGSQAIDELKAIGDNAINVSAIDALKTAIEGQDKLSGVKWIDGLSKIIRPLITLQWVVILYPLVICAAFFMAVDGGITPLQAMVGAFGTEEKAIVAFIIDFWFVGRVLDKVRR